MSDIKEDVTHDYDVFIIYAGCDEETAKHICRSLEAQGFRCIHQWKDDGSDSQQKDDDEAFKAGRPVFHSVVENMRRSQTTLLILTRDSFETSWVCLETILALEHSVQRGQMTLRLLLCDNVQESEISFLRKGLLEEMPGITVNLNKENWAENLANSLRERIALPEILPVGCLAHGQVFSHFVGYLAYLLPELEKIIEGTGVYKEKPDCVSKKLLMLVPWSCRLPSTLDTEDPKSAITISQVEALNVPVSHAGKQRRLTPPLYRVCKGTTEYFFIADLPNVLNAIFKIESQGLAKVDIKFQIARFYYTMNEVLNHKLNIKCANKVTLVPYNDSFKNMAEVVFNAVEEDILSQRAQQIKVSPVVTAHGLQSVLAEQQIYDNDLLIVAGDDDNVRHYANEILKFMEAKDKKVKLQEGNRHFHLNIARWVVFVLSKSSLLHEDGVLLKCGSVLIESVNQNMLRTLPVLVDVEPREMPQMIKWVTLVSVHEKDYKDRLLQTMNGGTITVEERLPSGDVSTGLAWAYVLNYLPHALLGKTETNLDFRGRIEKLLQDKGVTCGCIPKLFLLVPKSCLALDDIEAEANKSDIKPIQKVGTLEPVEVDTGGISKRPYTLHMFKYIHPVTKQSTCFLCEYVTPINCLHEMANHYSFAGLQNAEMHRQAEDFVQLFPAIIGREAVKKNIGDITDMVQLIYFDDKEESLLSAFEKKIKFREAQQAALVFAKQ